MTFLQAKIPKIPNLQPNFEEWTDENYNKSLKDAFQNCLPHIRYFQIPEVVEMGFYGETFHKLRDNIPGTMVILKTYNEILDGYNPLSWKTGDGTLGSEADKFAILYRSISKGPWFDNCDLGMRDDINPKNWYCEQLSYNKTIREGLTYNATLAELTSLEQLMSNMMAEEQISNDVIAKLWSEKIDLLLKIGLGPFGKTDLLLAKYTCIALQRLGGNKARIETDDRISNIITRMAINTIYLLGEHPDILCGEIIKHKTASVFDLKFPKADDMDIDGDNFLPDQEQFMAHPLQLSQLIFIVGHVAIKHIVHLEFIEDEWKRRKAEAESKDTEKSTKNLGDDELEQAAGTTEDEFGEAVAYIREKELLFGEKFIHHTLQICATLALVKLICVSSEFCENNLQLLFTILERSNEPTIRSNIIIASGDMTKNTLMVLTHLILNGMIKVKGQLDEIAKCLEDEDHRISDLARLFFTELASKDNAVYNNLPDIISNLSSGDNPVNEESFKKIMKFLFDFIEKDKHTENVVEKLCQRFKNFDDRRQWRNIAYCLSLLPYKSERIIKLLEGMSHYQDKLHDYGYYNQGLSLYRYMLMLYLYVY
ncbi:non-SMC mitotic condensation complex subunit 1-domain-containing protein [Gigaspora rosea]|uniref:Non-SMC mitotic condensation complex subunit 1-domain-containing protein n=1 Tax=Gigaspora rosea TaxID=44941 RepID=A0A397UTR0_9GLOM|nr:non-SMC mitotic condensation complex subunit 1-domain-containing protein [Gigaspora rosea]